jgi:sterol 3beta-glucosyltransferase
LKRNHRRHEALGTTMRILLLTLGTRGDVQPFIALGRGLQGAGHDVTLCTSSGFAPWIREHGLGYAHMNNDVLDLVNSDEGRKAFDQSGGILSVPKRLIEASRRFKAIFRRALAEEWEAAQASDAIVFNPQAVGGYHIAEALGVGAVMADPLPTWVPTSAFPAIVAPDLGLGGWYNRLTHRVLPVVPRLLFGGVVNRWRKQSLNLRPRSALASELYWPGRRPVPVLLGFSRHVLPPPADWQTPVYVSGYWFLEHAQDWQPPPSLVEFLAAGPTPVMVGFGSMAGRDPIALAQIVQSALGQSGQRGVVVTGWGGLSIPNPPPSIHVTQSVPYDWLLPRVSAVVHHGGAGTTAAGLRAGKPTIICPFVADQPFWGRRVAALGVGPPPIPQRKLTADRLAAAIRQAVSDTQMQERAVQLGEKIRAEDGIPNAVDFIEQHLHARPIKTPWTVNRQVRHSRD